jgi:hypothetical protein
MAGRKRERAEDDQREGANANREGAGSVGHAPECGEAAAAAQVNLA